MAGDKLSKVQIYDIFHTVPSTFTDTEYSAYMDVLEANDPVLRNISLYFIQHFNNLNVRCAVNDDCDLPCEIMNKWLNEKEAIYTSNGECTLNVKLWEKYIEKLWKTLGESSSEPNWCSRSRYTHNKKYPKNWIPHTCSNDETIDVSLSCNNNPYYKPEKVPAESVSSSSGSNISEFYGYVLFVVLLSSIFLYKFSPLGTWLDNKTGKKNRIRENINVEAMEELTRSSEYTSSPSSSKFNVIYHSLDN
ncbi:PIR Superfamily Protein [Plasmodium ovale wallikeri]|uniref:PIR Superfamily Protein n=1 Tax=Plasmodium ovale wallikeri TaxID=864142 RepID=A0A1A9AMN3_PLAOA|nr:PIR Superfamily Protein [Plasmodium ovale wallikeri]